MTPFTILFVDDDPGVIASLRRITRNADYLAHFASSGHEALEALAQHPIHMVVSDHKMPQMGGAELIFQVRRRFPHVIRVLFSGYADMKTLVDAINLGEVFRFIPKPWDLEEFQRIIAECRNEYERTHQDYLRTQALELLPAPVLIIQPESGTVIYANQAARRCLNSGRPFPEPRPITAGSPTLGWHLEDLQPVGHAPGTEADLASLVSQPFTIGGRGGRWTPLDFPSYPGHQRQVLVWQEEPRV